MENRKVSIIIPVYNAEKYLNRCVDSILSQTYKNMEIILLDDGSKDLSGKICDEYAQKDKRVQTFHLENGGPSRARNVGIEKSTGEVLAFVDADDYIANDMTQKMLDVMGDADIAMCNYYVCKDNNQTPYSHKLGDQVFDRDDIEKVFYPGFIYSDIQGLGAVWNKFYKKAFITANNLRFDEKLIRAEDFWFNFDCFSIVNKVVTTEKQFYYYVQDNDNSTMHTVRENQYEAWVYNRKKLEEFAKQINFELNYDKFYKGFLYNVSIYILQLIKGGYPKEKVFSILNDEFYNKALKYDKYLPRHIRVINKLSKTNKVLSYTFYKIWTMN